jgi:RimJ/RimL family protein N-acetyltransferase
MRLDEVGLRIDYFHGASDEHLTRLGVDRALLPDRGAWREFYEADYARPLPERLTYSLVWELDGDIVGFSSTDNITFGVEAFMHLHILDGKNRRRGMGTQFVDASAEHYFDALRLQHLYCQPNAYNVAPNWTLQRAGFQYECTLHTAPSAINYPQPITRWTLHRAAR